MKRIHHVPQDAAYNFTTIMHPWGPAHGAVGIDPTALYGYFERKDGGEGGGLWFERTETGGLELSDYDGTARLPMSIIKALRAHGVTVTAYFESRPRRDRNRRL